MDIRDTSKMITDEHGIPAYIPGGSFQSRFLGFPAMQNRYAVPLWSHFAELVPPARVIELGSHDGGFSAVLAILCRNYGAQFYTYERSDCTVFGGWDKLLGFKQRRVDVFMSETVLEIGTLIGCGGTTWLLCDNGDKEQEWKTYAPFLKAGDVIAAHDWCQDATVWVCAEFYPERIGTLLADRRIEQVTTPNFANAAWYVGRVRP